MAPLKAMPALLACACAVPVAVASDAPSYMARGQEPGWTVTITQSRIDYVGDYGETRISVPRPEPRPSFNGLRYETPRLTVDITYLRCNDAMSGHGYAHPVLVLADGRAVRGCGGPRRTDWDN